MATAAVLAKSLTLTDLTLFGLLSGLGTGGFSLVGEAVRAGGSWWPAALGGATAILGGSAHSYAEAATMFKRNTAESDAVRAAFGETGEWVAVVSVLVFGVLTISTMLVYCSHLLFPNAKWAGQIAFALALLAGLTLVALNGLESNTALITGVSAIMMIVLVGAAALGGVGAATRSPIHLRPGGFSDSLLLFFFILAGFETVIKFTEEAKDPNDVPRALYLTTGISAALVAGVAAALVSWLPHLGKKDEDNALGELFGHFLGPGVETGFKAASSVFIVITTFVVLLATTRYLYGIGDETPKLAWLSNLNDAKVPWVSTVLLAGVAGIMILFNHTHTLVRLADIALVGAMGLVSAAMASHMWREGKKWDMVVHILTSCGLAGVFGLSVV
jgi:APA family basic amino acid/polyamine antiporter